MTDYYDLKRKEAGELVHIFAFAHAVVAFFLANTLIGDAPVLTALTFWMIQKIGKIYNCNDLNPWKIMGKVFGFVAGTYLGAKLVGLIPGIGNIANAVATTVVTETIGWTCIFLMESFDDPNEVSNSEMKGIMERAFGEAQKHKEENKQLIKKMTKAERQKIRELGNRVQDETLSQEEKEAIFEEIESMRKKILAR
jgi:uncharacterized protein (DUF697 family)